MPIHEEIIESSATLVIAITGYRNNLGMSVEAFLKKSGLNQFSRIIVTDPTKLQTFGGIPPECPTFFDFLNYLQEALLRIKPKKLIITGTSAGAHTALLLGHLLKADQVVAFAPYPYLSIKEFKKRDDPALKSMWRVIEQFDLLPDEVKKYLDLKEVLSEWNNVTQYYVHVGRYNKWDYSRSMYLENTPNLSIIPHPYREHSVASLITCQGKLLNCFEFPYKQQTNFLDILFYFKFLIEHLSKRFIRLITKQ